MSKNQIMLILHHLIPWRYLSEFQGLNFNLNYEKHKKKNEILDMTKPELGTKWLTFQDLSPHYIFMFVYNFLFMINIHKRNTQINFRTNYNYVEIYNIIDLHA